MHNFSLVYNAVITPRFVAQTLVGVNYFKQVFDDANHGFNMASIGLKRGVTDPTDFGSPNINISGFDSTGLTPPLGRIDTTGHIDQTFTYTVGSHQFRFGGDYRYSRLDVFYDADAPGTFTFDGTQGPACRCKSDRHLGRRQLSHRRFARRARGFPFRPRRYRARQHRLRQPAAHLQPATEVPFLVRTSWKVTPKLTLNYGLNWVYQSPISNPKDLISTFIPADGGITYVGTHGLSTLWPRDLHDFAPRFGFAYQPKAGGKLVIRGGWGMFYQVPNIAYFGDSGASNGAATGINENIGGPAPVLTLVNQSPITLASGVPIFGGNLGDRPLRRLLREPAIRHRLQHEYEPQRSVSSCQGCGGRGWLFGQLEPPLAGHAGYQSDPASVRRRRTRSRPYYSQFPNLAAINEVQSVGNGHFNGLLASVRTTNFHGFTTKLSYTLGHSMDDLSYARHIIPQNSYCLRCDYGNSDFDIRNSFSMFLAYALPQPVKYRALLGGWQLNTLFSFFTGTPFTVYSGNDSSGTARVTPTGQKW